MGTTLRTLIEAAGGVRKGAHPQGRHPGRDLDPPLGPKHLDLALDFDTVRAGLTFLGAGGSSCSTPLTWWVCRDIISFLTHESCGQCTPCREGAFGPSASSSACSQAGPARDPANLERIADNVTGKTICALGDTVNIVLKAYLQKFRGGVCGQGRFLPYQFPSAPRMGSEPMKRILLASAIVAALPWPAIAERSDREFVLGYEASLDQAAVEAPVPVGQAASRRASRLPPARTPLGSLPSARPSSPPGWKAWRPSATLNPRPGCLRSEPWFVPELARFLKDRDSSLNALYRVWPWRPTPGPSAFRRGLRASKARERLLADRTACFRAFDRAPAALDREDLGGRRHGQG